MENKNNKEIQKEEEMRKSLPLRKRGNSLSITIPKNTVDFLGAEEGDFLEIEIIKVHKKKEKK